MTMRPLGTARPDIAADIKRRMVAKEPGLRMSDLTVTVHEAITEREHPLKRSRLFHRLENVRPELVGTDPGHPPMFRAPPEPTNKTPIPFPSAQRRWPLTPGSPAAKEAEGPLAPDAGPAGPPAKPTRGPGEGADASSGTGRLGLGIPESERLVPRQQPGEER